MSNLNETTKEFISGLAGGIASVLVCHPLDVARTMMNIMATPGPNYRTGYETFSQTLKTIYQKQHWHGFYKGLKTTIISIPLFNCIYFPIYSEMKRQLSKRYDLTRTQAALGSAFVAGAISDVVSNPLWVVRTRVMVQVLRPANERYQETFAFSVMNQIIKEQGVHALFKGLSASVFGLIHACVYFPIYEYIKHSFNANEKKLTNMQVFLSSVVSKLIACTVTYPHIVIRTLMHDNRSSKHLRIRDIVREVYSKSGVKGFFLGLKPDLIRVIPSNAITFVVYQLVKRNL